MDYNQKMSSNLTCSNSFWTREEDKAFENALAIYSDISNPWEKIAAAVPGRTVEEIKNHFEVLVADVNAIESGLVPLPHYADSTKKSTKRTVCAAVDRKGKRPGKNQSEPSHRERSSQSYVDRRRGIPWSKEEHRLFLQGLEKYGRGDWRSISRLCVRSRTATQVASHAQKYFRRMDIGNKDSSTLSIHDVTILDDGKIVTQKVPTTKQIAGPAGGCLVDSGLYPSSNPVDIDLSSSLIDKQNNISTPGGPITEEMIGGADFDWLDCLLDNLDGVSTPQGPSAQQITEAAGVSLCTPLIASQQHSSTVQERIAEHNVSAGVDFCSSLFNSQYNLSTPRGAMSGQMIGTAAGGAYVLNFEESSSRVYPDCGAYAPTASQLIPEPVPSDVTMLGFFPPPKSPVYKLNSPDFEAFLVNSPDDIVSLTYQMPPSGQNRRVNAQI